MRRVDSVCGSAEGERKGIALINGVFGADCAEGGFNDIINDLFGKRAERNF